MSDDQIRRAMIDHFGIRIQPHMAQYVQRRFLQRNGDPIPVIGGDARTGVAIRKLIALAALEQAAASTARRAT